MMLLATTSDVIRVVTSGTADIHCYASWIDNATGTITPGSTPTAITSATTTTLVAAPGSSTQRNVRTLNIRNKHATTSNTLTIQFYNGTAYEIFAVTLLAGETVEYVDGQGWRVYDSTGQVKIGQLAVDPSRNDFRLSGVSATPVMTADSTTLSTIYLAQYRGNNIALYDGTNWQLATPSSEVSLAVTGRTTDLPFDVFAYLNSGAVTLEFLDWTSATARATGLTRASTGVWTKTGDTTRRYLGSVRARSATTFHWVTAGTDLPVKFDLFNVDNRVDFGFTLKASTDSWAYTTATIRQAQGSTNYQVDLMVGLQEEYFDGVLIVSSRNSTISILRSVGIGFDSTTTYSGLAGTTANTVASITCVSTARLVHQPTIGRHFYSWNEWSTATGACTFVGDDGTTNATAGLQSGISGNWNC